jgi:hypothetical protein
MNNDYAKRIDEARKYMEHDALCDVIGGHDNGCTCGMQAASDDLDAIIASVPLLTEPWCEKGDACVCGGDTPQVRRTCDYWVEGKP